MNKKSLNQSKIVCQPYSILLESLISWLVLKGFSACSTKKLDKPDEDKIGDIFNQLRPANFDWFKLLRLKTVTVVTVETVQFIRYPER